MKLIILALVIYYFIIFFKIKYNISLGTIINKYEQKKHIVLWYHVKGYYFKSRKFIYLFTIKL